MPGDEIQLDFERRFLSLSTSSRGSLNSSQPIISSTAMRLTFFLLAASDSSL